MKRKDFIYNCGLSCLGATFTTILLDSCSSSKIITATIDKDELIVPRSHFNSKENTNYIVVHNDSLQYPVCIYKQDQENYTALLMRCTHRSAELQVFGQKLHCPAHGSEFDAEGNVVTGPADKNLRRLPVTITSDHLRISLKK